MSTLVHTPASPAADVRRPSLRLLERPVLDVLPAASTLIERETVGDWLARQVERYWAWGERHAGHHRLGSWLKH